MSFGLVFPDVRGETLPSAQEEAKRAGGWGVGGSRARVHTHSHTHIHTHTPSHQYTDPSEGEMSQRGRMLLLEDTI